MTLRLAVAAAATVGLKVTLMVQFAPAAKVVPQVVVWANDVAEEPVKPMAMPVSVVALPFVRVTVCAVLVVLMF